MRYPKEQKEQTRGRIIEGAARSFRLLGANGIGVADLMKEAQLTHGGFYRHFASKEELLGAAISWSLDKFGEQLTELGGTPAGPAGLERIIDFYLSEAHCLSPQDGCMVAALAPEISRHPAIVQEQFQNAVSRYRQRLLPFLPGQSVPEKEQAFALLFTGMAGALMTARAFADAQRRNNLLQLARGFYSRIFASR